ncbi:uncharacterized protein LOC121695542 isoform X2 [Alosa sapidissima]|uniref:uncharacterized protein LOC121695542 isoform X2 n=1 Tax=Alosa sapidissima TaxID=34773 RepID=UPI001C092012|nr:uncharacterized protein LOC121695542 isoform X2 [Alosa sapidissima]XP_041932432.1 uncharacterized protein LOC121695542 isoform X2 [Alosa sapidissima]XP_041932433.1 uncharacterized protein LOC121695542 isoform X2 [Alosa sapidissima]XP_041932434.1 uncharacterized protein LOC121695542 isoform X2 [Alosa sapidissima]
MHIYLTKTQKQAGKMSTNNPEDWCLRLILLCCSLKTLHGSGWDVYQSPDFIEEMVGNSITLKCHIANIVFENSCESIIWAKVHPRNGELVVADPASDKNFDAAKNETTKSCDLIVIGQSQAYSGMYYCWAKAASIRIQGNGSRVSFTGTLTASVELFSPRNSNASSVPFICWAKGVVPSQVRIFWIMDGSEYNGHTESIWSNDSHKATEFTQSRTWFPDWTGVAGIECTCVVEIRGKNISKTIQYMPGSAPNSACLVLVYGISFTSLFIVAGWLLVVIYHGQKSKKTHKIDHRHKFSKHGTDTLKGPSYNEVLYSSLKNIQPPTSAGLQRDYVAENGAEVICLD